MKTIRPQWFMLVLAFLTSLTMHLLLFSYSQLKEPIILEMQLTYAQAGFIFSMSVLALIIIRVPWGIAIDRLGVRVAGGLALTLLGVFGVLRGFATGYETLLLFQLFLGVGLAAVMPCLPKLVAAYFPHEKVGSAIGISISGYAVGDVIALSGSPYLLTLLGGWRNVFYVYGTWAVILTAIWWSTAREPSQNYESLQSSRVRPNSSFKANFATLLKIKQVWLLSGLYFTAAACYDTILLWLPSMLDAKGVTLVTSGFITSMLPLGFLVASFVVSALSDRVGLRKPFILFLGLISGPAIYATGVFVEPALWFSALLVGICTIGVLTVVLIMPVELPQTTNIVGSTVGLISSVGNLGSFFFTTIVGQIRDITGSFMWSVLILAILGEFMLVLGLPLTETGRKKADKCQSSLRS